ncbi:MULTISPECIES: hypothetical protein [Anaerococcus]|uniref:hypothetical protein n=1 Tax=Anaerococcus TaxID=165779 RepID=UPI0027BA6BFE|nr:MULTISPECIES: hypothetical protein [Anaerococcus]MDU2557557.1 hypothetical protein [Anaerococcus prevotii]MDU3136347.1 hypothetical protein [Anaerococcus prevotii]
MINLVLGEQGVGKTKYLVEEANKEKEKGNNNIVFVDTDDSQINTLDHKVRLINAKSYKISNIDGLLGFIGGILARDYDIGKIYLDGIYDIIDINKDNIEELSQRLKDLSEYSKSDIYLGLDWTKEDVPSSLDAEVIELKLED